MKAVIEDNNLVTEENNPKEAPIFVIEDNWKQLVTKRPQHVIHYHNIVPKIQ